MKFTALCLPLALAIIATPAAAVWPPGGRPVTDGPPWFDQEYLYETPDSRGGVFVAWAYGSTYIQNITAEGAYAPGFDSSLGQLVPPGWGYMPGSHHYIVEPAGLLDDGTGGAYVALFAGDDCPAECGGEPGQLMMQRITPTGTPAWPATGVMVDPAYIRRGVAAWMALSPGGAALLAWRSAGEPGPTRIVAQAISPDGRPLWGEQGVTLVIGTISLSSPTVVSDRHGGAFVFWIEDRAPDTTAVVRAQHVSDSGVPLWLEGGVVISEPMSSYGNPVAVEDGANGSIVAWTGGRAADLNLRAARVTQGGGRPWGEISLCAAAGDQFQLTEAATGDGGLLAAWQDHRALPNGAIYAQRVSHSGRVEWGTDGTPVCTVPGTRGIPGISSDGAGGAYVAWADSREDVELFASRLDAQGQLRAGWQPNGTPVCARVIRSTPFGTERSAVEDIAMSGEPDGRAMLTWQDYRIKDPDGPMTASDYDFAMLLTPDGPVASAILPTVSKAQTRDQLTSASPNPSALSIQEITPAPATTASRVVFTLPSAAPARLELLDVSGRRVVSRSLELSAGEHEIALFDHGAAAGVYFVRLSQGLSFATRRIVVTP